RHTRCYRDWSSDVCSSDLSFTDVICPKFGESKLPLGRSKCGRFRRLKMSALNSPRMRCGNENSLAMVVSTLKYFGPSRTPLRARSEERRVGKEGRRRMCGA